MNSLTPLFSPLSIRGVQIRNRFMMPAMQRGFVRNSIPTDQMVEYLRSRGAGGVGLIISESCGVEHPSAYWQDVFCYLTRDSLGQWRKLVDAVKGTGARFLMQLWHPGSLREVNANSPFARYPTLSPSGLIQEGRTNGRAISRQELDDVKAAYVRAAEHAISLGADGVEIHAAHGYFLDQFLWHETNRREDEYGGGTLAERARYPAEIVAAIRAVAGPNFVISFRLSQFKEVDYGASIANSPESLGELLSIIKSSGADCFNASSRKYYKPEWPDRDPILGWAGWTKFLTDSVVISVGSVGLSSDIFEDLLDNKNPELRMARDLQDIVRRISANEFDLIGIGRAHIANADFVKKVYEQRLDDIIVFNKANHLGEFVEEWEKGVVDASRKID